VGETRRMDELKLTVSFIQNKVNKEKGGIDEILKKK
jgi:hypothetical protein